MAAVQFEVLHRFDHSVRTVWEEMIDWKGHADWIPSTRVELHDDDPHAVGSTFTAWTGIGKLSLEDRMRVAQLDWDEPTRTGTCEVEKLGPVLRGTAGFTVSPDGEGSRVRWVEDVTVPFVPRFLAPVVAKLSAMGFAFGMKRLAKLLDSRAPAGDANAA